MTVYIVTTGTKSNYTVEAAFSTRELAEEFAKRFMAGQIPNVAAFHLDKFALDYWVCVQINKAGTYTVCWVSNVPAGVNMRGSLAEFAIQVPRGTDVALAEKLAITAANERRIMAIADGIWGDEEKMRERWPIGFLRLDRYGNTIVDLPLSHDAWKGFYGGPVTA